MTPAIVVFVAAIEAMALLPAPRVAGALLLFENASTRIHLGVSLAEHLLGKLTTASQAAMRVELKLRMQEAPNSMAPNDREVLILRHFEELSNAEAAEVLGIKPSAAVNRYVRALKKLKDVFQGMSGGIERIWG
jgi:RNA polymerase sigma-70 factor (ECF subfamily)